MKLLENPPNDVFYIQINKIGFESERLTVYDCTREELVIWIKELILKQNLSPFENGKKTSIVIRRGFKSEDQSRKVTDARTISFRGLDPKEVYDLILTNINR